ncbi:uncharacterized protein RSE6_12214 [Rhynchosporium secalis]|uniref:Secreted protein n=1 Tax=Rhynchosporium secalis TaxID=38038 RepID=A0A1E1MPW0_RHYSE|nr:uncharacterized protein RSE6_12214 [Rhynchosporium secalis]
MSSIHPVLHLIHIYPKTLSAILLLCIYSTHSDYRSVSSATHESDSHETHSRNRAHGIVIAVAQAYELCRHSRDLQHGTSQSAYANDLSRRHV